MASVAAATALFVGPANAVKFGEPDGNRHPWVGLVVFHDSSGVPLWRCSGSLIDSDTFLTAAHCTEAPAAKAVVFFDPGPIPRGDWGGPGTSCAGKTGYPCKGDAEGTPIPHPAWTGALTVPNTHDVGVVQLSSSRGGPYGALAPASYLDGLATRRGQQNVELTVVGYGLQSVRPTLSSIPEREVGTVTLVNLRNALTDGYNIQYSSNPGKGHGGSGGTCFGDSGGPVLHWDGTKEVIVGVNSFVLNQNCAGTAFAHRVDIADSREFLVNYTTVP
ncbi:MAG: serine protease [Thermoleophilia bacterium]